MDCVLQGSAKIIERDWYSPIYKYSQVLYNDCTQKIVYESSNTDLNPMIGTIFILGLVVLTLWLMLKLDEKDRKGKDI